MCLDKIIENDHILEEDLTVFKVVKYNLYSKHSFFGIWSDHCQRINKGLNEAKYKIKIHLFQLYSENKFDEYTTGFHCLENYPDASDFMVHFYAPFINYSLRIRKFVIPKGTKVTIGEQSGLKVIVTPVLINQKG